MLYAIVAVLVIIVDQWIKYWVAGAISLESTGRAFIPGILSLVNLHNDGAAFSFLAGGGARIYFIILTGAFTVAVIIALATRFISGRFSRWCIVLVAAGGVSNCIDRVIYGYVQDMFKTEFINFPVFNLADVFITVFCLLFVLAILFERDRDDDDYDDEAFDLEDDEDEAPPRRMSARERRAARRAAAEEEEAREQAKAAQAARERAEAQRAAAAARARQQAQAQRQSAPQAQPKPQADPFAEWERATAQQNARQQAAARAAVQQQSAAPVQPAQPARPAAQPAPKPAASDDSFSLDDILAEFK